MKGLSQCVDGQFAGAVAVPEAVFELRAGAALTSNGRDGRQQTDANGQHQKAKQENCHLGHKASEGKGAAGTFLSRSTRVSGVALLSASMTFRYRRR